jgi:hypothetical protein
MAKRDFLRQKARMQQKLQKLSAIVGTPPLNGGDEDGKGPKSPMKEFAMEFKDKGKAKAVDAPARGPMELGSIYIIFLYLFVGV